MQLTIERRNLEQLLRAAFVSSALAQLKFMIFCVCLSLFHSASYVQVRLK